MLRVEEGSLYPALHRLEESRFVKARWMVTNNNRRARVYEITATGRRQLDVEEKRWRAVTLAVGQVLERICPSRAGGNHVLVVATRQRRAICSTR